MFGVLGLRWLVTSCLIQSRGGLEPTDGRQAGRVTVGREAPSSRAVGIAGVILVALVLVACAALGVTTAVLPGCEGCHFGRPTFEAATRGTAHGHVACVECHVQTGLLLPRAKFAFYEIVGMRLRLVDPSSTDVAFVKDGQCLSCHANVMTSVTATAGLRVNHASCSVGRRCVDCHSVVGHGPATRWPRVSSMNDCVACHKKTQAPLVCSACHVGRSELRPFVGPEWALTHGPTWRQTHGMGQMSVCSLCHSEDKCSRCHGPGVPHPANWISSHPTVAVRADAKCAMCHQKTFCLGCHQTEMPHPATFARGHSRFVQLKGSQLCLRCHAQTDCDTCHLRHVHPGGSVGNVPRPKTGGR